MQPRLIFNEPGALPPMLDLKQSAGWAQDRSTTAHVYLSPDNFLEMTTTPADHLYAPSTDWITEAMQRGDVFGVPWLVVQVGERGWKIREHEGRHRSQAMKRLGYAAIPVVLIFRIGSGSQKYGRMYWDEEEGYVEPQIDDDEDVNKMLKGHKRLVHTQSYFDYGVEPGGEAQRIPGRFEWLVPLTPDGRDLFRHFHGRYRRP
jgi:hypothetical protein